VDTDVQALCYKVSYMIIIVRNCLEIETLSAFTVMQRFIYIYIHIQTPENWQV